MSKLDEWYVAKVVIECLAFAMLFAAMPVACIACGIYVGAVAP